MKKFIKFVFFNLTLFSAATLTFVGIYGQKIADGYYVQSSSILSFENNSYLECKPLSTEVSVGRNNSESVKGQRSVISLFGIIPIKNVTVTNVEKTDVAVLGTPFGIKMYTEGVLVVGFSDVETTNGNENPALSSGVSVGDNILQINGKDINSNSEMQDIINKSNGEECELIIKRNDKIINLKVRPQKSKSDNIYKIGLWIRDSSAGIGTLTFYSPSSDVLAGLGHGVCDVDTGELVSFQSGEMIGAEIVGIKKADKSTSGELRGVFASDVFAEIQLNEITGVYGTKCKSIEEANVMPIALKQEICEGQAEILTTVDGGKPKLYKCNIEKIYHNDASKIKNMVIKVTDKELLEKTGGIVQGMSGSPVLQNGKLVGAITHVLIDDPTKGYGIFSENMLETAKNVEKTLKDAG